MIPGNEFHQFVTPGPRTRERIIEAAVHLFSNQGFNATSTREIARVADVNETSVFRYFPRKQDLFWAALESHLARLRPGKELLGGMAENKPPEQVVPLILQFLVETATYQPELIRLLRFGLLELRPQAERVCRQDLGPVFDQIVRYIGGCMGADPNSFEPWILLVALCSTGLIQGSVFRLFTGHSAPFANTEEATAAYSRFWLSLLRGAGNPWSFKPASAAAELAL